MKLMFLDFETTERDPKKARVVEYCFRAVDTTTGDDVIRSGYLWDPSYKLEPGAVEVHGLTQEKLEKEGGRPQLVWDALAASIIGFDLVIAHNARAFDKIVLEEEFKRHGHPVPKARYLDTRFDLPFPEKMNCRKLTHLCLDHGIKVDVTQAHGAAYDVDLMKQLVEKYDIQDVLAILTSPLCVVKAHVSYDERELAKARGYRWEKTSGGQTFLKTWIKEIRKANYRKELDEAPFHISIIHEVPYA
jgi:DNA polymerase-3 subunit epsilon